MTTTEKAGHRAMREHAEKLRKQKDEAAIAFRAATKCFKYFTEAEINGWPDDLAPEEQEIIEAGAEVCLEWLTNHGDDDHEPITAEWLESVGFKLEANGKVYYYIDIEIEHCHDYWRCRLGGGSWVSCFFVRRDVRQVGRAIHGHAPGAPVT